MPKFKNKLINLLQEENNKIFDVINNVKNKLLEIYNSDFKEKFDQWNNVYAKSHKVSIEEAIADSEQDQIANRLGRERGRRYPNCDCSTLMYDLLPNYKK